MRVRGPGDPLTPALSPRRGGRTRRRGGISAAPAPSAAVRPRRFGAGSRARRSPHPRPLPQERGPDALGSLVRPRGPRRVRQSRAQRVLVRDGGVGGAAPHRRCAPASEVWWGLEGPVILSPPPSPKGEGAGSPSELAGVLLIRRGRGGGAPHRKKIRGRVGGSEPRAARARPGWGCGGRSPPQEMRACSRGPQSGYVLAAAWSARRAIARGRPSKMRRWIGQSAYQ